MSKIALTPNASGSGTFTIAAPNSNTDRTLVLPDEAGTVLTSASDQVAGPAFSAYKSGSSQTLTSGVVTRITYESEDFDTNSCFASSTFTPTVAGYYQLNVLTYGLATSGGIDSLEIRLYKNGGLYQILSKIHSSRTSGDYGDLIASGSTVVYSNGTDSWEVYVRSYAGSNISISAGRFYNNFNGCLVRTA